jgi:hypothetical protein
VGPFKTLKFVNMATISVSIPPKSGRGAMIHRSASKCTYIRARGGKSLRKQMALVIMHNMHNWYVLSEDV